MTEQHHYRDRLGTPLLTIERDETLAADLLLMLPTVSDRDWISVPPARLLAMIDRAAPDAMRAYLRERSDLIDGPGEPLTVNGANMTAEQAVYADVPEADSPEDVDERPAPATTERLALLGQIRDLYPNLPPSRHIGVVHWLLEGTVLIERVERLLDRPDR
ncbi:hypothetical protein ACTXLB_02400 [Brachybacterium tyrofermentans]|uniref:hypothetical protein n=1 Tax=Brachybacterium tyrofermentans TaxID=47848 RepID=UPI003FCF9600